jgi:hypothetical protein
MRNPDCCIKIGEGNLITRGGMAAEGSGPDWYGENTLVGKFVNSVSKAHAWFNSDVCRFFEFKGYNVATGMWWRGGG